VLRQTAPGASALS